ncbi:MAG: hypothetical protein ACHQVS_05395 [Candidatus Babeliales bacterium]
MNYNSPVIRFCFFLLMLFHHVCSSCTAVDHCHIDLALQSAPPPVITHHEERDLELFDSHNKSHSGVFSAFDKTYTASGKACLMHHLKNPTTDVTLLQARQEQIKLLLENPALLEEIKTLLARIKASEQDLLYFINNQDDPVARTVIDTFYFKNGLLKDFNKSSVALDARNYVKQLGLFSPVIEHLILHYAVAYFKDAHHGHDHDEHGVCLVHSLKPSGNSSALVKAGLTVLEGVHLGIHLVSIKEMIQQMGAELGVVNQLYKKVASVKEGLQAITAVHERMQENDYAYNAFVSHPLDANINLDTGIKTFAPLLNSTYFDSASSLGYLSPIGSTLYNYQMLKNNVSVLQSYMAHVADIDALVSVAQWYKEHATKKAPVCFVDFVTSSTPIVKLESMWHVGLNAGAAILNDIELNADKGAYKFIITGPNKSGKSTIIKSVGLNIILAQTFGIAVAREAHLTPFHTLLSYITVTDDVQHDRSTFVAELVRAEECIQALHSLKPDQFACLLIDDSLFKGTTFEKSQDMALRFLTTLGTFPNSCALIATHCAVLTQLEQEKPAIFKNYRIKMGIDTQGDPASMFTLEEGIANQDAVFDIITRQRSVSF